MAVDLFRKGSGAELVLLHCVSLYPTRPEQENLSRITSLSKRFNLAVGFSDHTRGQDAPVLAAALGARIFEKHFTIDRLHDCPDKDISCTPEEFASLIEAVETAITMLGTGDLSYGEAEAATARASRRSLFAHRNIPRGKVIDEDDVVALRPGVGIPVYERKQVIGKRSRIDIPADFLIKKEYIV
jgi:N,N'-diacetyllegionaminate synthase